MLLTIEEYIARRKKEDHLNEFSLNDRMENMRVCVNYVFEYYNQYLDISKVDEKTILNDERLEKYRKNISQFDSDIQDWLIGIYDEYDKQLNKTIISYIKKDDLFYLYYSDSEFRSLSYDCYAHIVKKNPFMKDQTEMLYLFIKDYHQTKVHSTIESYQLSFSEDIDQWVEKTRKKYKVDIIGFCSDWVNSFYERKDQWEVRHRKKSNNNFSKYEYDFKQKSNLFNINLLYKRISDRPFIKGKKQYLEIIMMYFWLHEIVGDDEGYWQEYINKCLVD